jgi:hypothetical protein
MRKVWNGSRVVVAAPVFVVDQFRLEIASVRGQAVDLVSTKGLAMNDTRNLDLITRALKAYCFDHPEVTGVTLTMTGGTKNYTFTPTGEPLAQYAQLAERLAVVCEGNGTGSGLA